jgi:hypothetical protein
MTELRKIDLVEPSYGLLERAEVGPVLPEPRPRPVARATVVLVAILVAAVGGWGVFVAFRDVGGNAHRPAGDSEAFPAVWPETTLAEAEQVQARVDSGDPEVQWRTDAAEVALRYAKEMLGWPDPIAGLTTPHDPDALTVSLHGPVASCQGAQCQDWQPQQVIVTITLQRLVRPGEGGIWSVTAVQAPDETAQGTRPRIGGWPEDANGDGVISDTGAERIPELIKAVGDHGVEGYVRYEDLDGLQPANPSQAVAMSGKERVLPLYAPDGITVVDWYTISSGEGRPSVAPLPGGGA